MATQDNGTLESEETLHLDGLDQMATINETIKPQQVSDRDKTSHLKTFKLNTTIETTITQSLGPSQIVQTIDRFDYQADLGEGAHGKVWKAKDNDIGRTVAVKSYKYNGNTAQKLFNVETNIAGKIDHPNVPALYDVRKTDNDQFHFIMKYVEGETLSDIILRLRAKDPQTHQQYRFEQRASLIIQVLRALDAAHTQGVVHRDIKAENIMVASCGVIYLMDWGVALDLSQNNGEGELAGTPRYMSPEQAMMKKIDTRSDIYSLTAVFFELMTLMTHGPKAETLGDFIQQIPTHKLTLKDIKPRFGEGYPLEYATIILKGLALHPEDRYTNAEEMIEHIESVMSGQIVVQCSTTFLLKIIYSLRSMLIKYPSVANFGIIGAFIGLILVSIFIGTLL